MFWYIVPLKERLTSLGPGKQKYQCYKQANKLDYKKLHEHVQCALYTYVCAQRDIVGVYNILLKHTKETLNLMFCLSSAKLCMLTMLHLTLTLHSLPLQQELMCAGVFLFLFLHTSSYNISTSYSKQ